MRQTASRPPKKLSFNRGAVKEDFRQHFSIYDWFIAAFLVIAVVYAFTFGHAGDVVCRVHGRLRGRGMPAAG